MPWMGHLVPPWPHPPAVLKKLDRPVVLIDRPGPGYAVVHSNYVMGGELLAQYARRMGHRRVACCVALRTWKARGSGRDGFVNASPGQIEIAWEVNVGFDGVLTPKPWRRSSAAGMRL